MTMAMNWVLYCIVLSCVLALGARILEGAARASGGATRWPWTVALFASVLLPLISWLRPVHVVGVDTPVSLDVVTAPFVAPVTASAPVHSVPFHPGVLLWATASLLSLIVITVSYVRLMRARRSWTQAEVDGVQVWVSEDVGPAAFGVVRRDIVVPRWILAIEARALRLMMLHEREHLRAWDPRLMLASLLMVAAMPWNPAVWFIVRRLRLAIEIDCDARVLAQEPDRATYGAVLLEVGRRRSSNRLALATFAEPRSQLEQRIRRMAASSQEKRFMRAAVLCAFALPLCGAAYAMHAPIHARTVVDPPLSRSMPPIGNSNVNVPDGIGDDGARADTIPPRLADLPALSRDMNRNYPPSLRDAGIWGSVTVSVHVRPDGRVSEQRIIGASGYKELDEAATKVAGNLVFIPASSGGRRVDAWVAVAMTFNPEGQSAEVSRERRADLVEYPPEYIGVVHGATLHALHIPDFKKDTVRASHAAAHDTVFHINGTLAKTTKPTTTSGYVLARTPPDTGTRFTQPIEMWPITADGTRNPAVAKTDERSLQESPVFTPMTVRPALANRDEVTSAIANNYPPQLRNTGIGGKALVWFYIDADGRNVRSVLKTSSGIAALDQAAMRAAMTLRFTPAENQGKRVPVWIAIPIAFSPSVASTSNPASQADTAKRMNAEKPSMSVKPRITNVPDVEVAISQAYPAALRDRGIGGKVVVWMYVNTEGRVVKQMVQTSSGVEDLDKAALTVGPVLRFQAAEENGHAVPVWIQIPIVFTVH